MDTNDDIRTEEIRDARRDASAHVDDVDYEGALPGTQARCAAMAREMTLTYAQREENWSKPHVVAAYNREASTLLRSLWSIRYTGGVR